MVTADLTSGLLLKPFLVLTGKTGATLDKEYADWATMTNGTATVAFQHKHWFGTRITLRWLEWLKCQYGQGTKIGLIWDHAPSHDCDQVAAYLANNSSWLTVEA